VGAKAKNVRPEGEAQGWGVWTWTAIDADTKLCVSYLVGGPDAGWAGDYMEDCASRIRSRVQVTTNGHKPYLEAVEGAFGMDVDYPQLQKIYPAPTDDEMRRYTRLTNGFSKKVDNHAHMVAIHFMHYNFAKIYKNAANHPCDGCWPIRSRLES
jgi:hypothetical protein